jgi:uncharacterized protein (TIGR03089 family)
LPDNAVVAIASTDIRGALLAREDPAQPFVTYLGAEGRMELSGASVANAAAKIANALSGEFDLQAGDCVGVHIPWHWQRVTWLIGIWTAGCSVVPGGGEECDLIVAGPQEAAGLPGTVQVVSMHPFGMPLDQTAMAQLPPGIEDVTLAVRSQPDQQVFVDDHGSQLALDGLTQSALLAQGRDWAASLPDVTRLGIVPGPRQWSLPAIWPLVTRGSVVLAADFDEERRTAEQIDAVAD